MHFVTAIGPIRTHEGQVFIGIASAEGGELSSRLAPTRDAAVSDLATSLPRGLPVTCDPSLSSVAASYGWTPGPLPRELVEVIALLGVGMMHGPLLRKLSDPSVVIELMNAAAAYARAQPWERFTAAEPLELKISGAASGTRWGLVFGGTHEEFGLSLYETRAAFDCFLELARAEEPRQAMHVDALSCILSFEPGAIVDLMHRAFDVAFEPHFVLLKGGRPQPLRVDDVRFLTASLRALTSVARRGAVGTGVCELLGKRVEVTVKVSAPEVDPAELPAVGPQPSPVHRLDVMVLPQLLALARTLPGWSGGHLLAGAPDLSLNCTLALFVHPHEGTTVASRFLEAQSSEDDRRWVAAHQQGWLSLFEVDGVCPGKVALHDLLLDRPVVIHDVGLSRTAKLHDVLLLWLIDFDGVSLAAANKDAALGLEEALKVRDSLRGAFATIDRKELGTPALVDALLAAVRARGQAPSTDTGVLTNTDKDVMSLGADRYALREAPAVVAALLAHHPDAFEADELNFTVTKLGNALHPTWRRTVMATIELEKKALTVKANSQRRLDWARQWLAGALGERIAFVERTSEASSLPQMSGSVDVQALADGPWTPLIPTLELRSVWVGAAGASLYSTDETTRAKARRRAHLSIAHHERSADELVRGLDLRRAVGLSWRGDWLGPDSVWLGLGAGIPMSLALQAICAPVLAELDGDLRTSFSDALRLAWAAWGVAGQRVSTDEATALARRSLLPAKRPKKSDGPALTRHLAANSPNVDNVLAAVPWAIERTRLLFPLDRRQVMEVRVTAEVGLLNCQAYWTVDRALEAPLMPLGYSSAEKALQRYEDLTLDSKFAWKVTPPAWRHELVAEYLRASPAGFADDFGAEVEARVRMEDALLEQGHLALRAACKQLEGMPLKHGAAVKLLANLAARNPKVMTDTIQLTVAVSQAVLEFGELH